MFQSDSLLPWRTAIDNVMIGPILRGTNRKQARRAAEEWLARVGLRGFESRYPHHLSGGQRKRVAMAQVLINEPEILLMDEPFGALDAQTRTLMGDELLNLWSELGSTVLFVTHDLEEAVALSDRVLLVTSGPRATIRGDYPVSLDRPRQVTDARFLPGFDVVYERVWKDLKEEVMFTYERSR
jgi:NitT/TauT family transport system ATP-binding protein